MLFERLDGNRQNPFENFGGNIRASATVFFSIDVNRKQASFSDYRELFCPHHLEIRLFQ